MYQASIVNMQQQLLLIEGQRADIFQMMKEGQSSQADQELLVTAKSRRN